MTWKHSSVARWFSRLGKMRADESSFSAGVALAQPDPQWRVENLRLIAIVQEDESRKVAAIGVTRWLEAAGPAPGAPAASGSVSGVPAATSKSFQSSSP